MSDKRSIEAAFAKANVPLVITDRSLNRRLIRGGGQIVQMAIVRNRQGNEIISMNIPDGEAIDVRALGADPEHQQVVVMVHEPARKIVQERFNFRTLKMERETIRVPEGKRRFLVGMDECHLFIAQMRDDAGATSVKQAHKDLRPKEVPAPKQAKKLKIKRTGEWFLVPATSEEIKEIEEHIKLYGSRKNVGIGGNSRGRGRPHVVTESVIIRSPNGQTEFVLGRILHPDHKVVKLKEWHRVIMNTENRSVGSQWVD
ncbi:MAG: hypothetical protein AB7L09_00065 [Nitrospira sp.]